MAGEFIGVDALIAEASSVIKNVTEREKQLMLQWAYTGLRKIGVGRLDMKFSDPLYLTDFSVAKPTDLAITEDIALFDSADREIVVKYNGRSQANSDTWVTGTSYVAGNYVINSNKRYICILDHTAPADFTTDQATNWEAATLASRIHQDIRPWVGAINVTEDDTYFNVEEFTDESPSGAYLVVRYYGYPIDSNGMPKIPETHTLAIMMYIRWMWAMREAKSLGEIQVAREVWLREKGAAYGRMKTPSPLEMKETARTINSMIQKTVKRHRQF